MMVYFAGDGDTCRPKSDLNAYHVSRHYTVCYILFDNKQWSILFRIRRKQQFNSYNLFME